MIFSFSTSSFLLFSSKKFEGFVSSLSILISLLLREISDFVFISEILSDSFVSFNSLPELIICTSSFFLEDSSDEILIISVIDFPISISKRFSLSLIREFLTNSLLLLDISLSTNPIDLISDFIGLIYLSIFLFLL